MRPARYEPPVELTEEEIEQRRKERLDRGIKVRSESIYALMSWRELSYLFLPRLVLIGGLLILPLVMPSMYWQRVISIVCIYALLALSFDFLAYLSSLLWNQIVCEK